MARDRLAGGEFLRDIAQFAFGPAKGAQRGGGKAGKEHAKGHEEGGNQDSSPGKVAEDITMIT